MLTFGMQRPWTYPQNIIAAMIQIMTGNRNKPMCQRNMVAFTFCDIRGCLRSGPKSVQTCR